MFRVFKNKVLSLYWNLMRCKEIVAYRTKRYFRLLSIWLRGIGRISENLSGAEHAESLIICAHPDDETIFFYTVIKKEKPFVICMSHSGDSIRKKEFEMALQSWGSGSIMLNLPDVPGMMWLWKLLSVRKLNTIRAYFPNVKRVYTHARSGESGHPHHFLTHDAVTSVFGDLPIYITASKFEPIETGRLSPQDIDIKMKIIKDIYSTQVNMLVRWCDWFENYLRYEVFYEEK